MLTIREMNQPVVGVLFELICTARLDPFNNLDEQVTIMWFNTSLGTSLNDRIGTSQSPCINATNSLLVESNATNSLPVEPRVFESRIMFDPLIGSHAGDITCQAVVEPPNIYVHTSESRQSYDLELESGTNCVLYDLHSFNS